MGWSPFRRTGLTFANPSKTAKGYTLITPIRGDGVYLIDMQGRIVHRWRLEQLRPWYALLLPSGRLLVAALDPSLPRPPASRFDQSPLPFDQRIRRFGGQYTHLLELGWDGEVLWQYHNPHMHHDFVRLADGHTLISEWVELPAAIDKQVRGGARRPKERFAPLISDDFVEIDAAGNEVGRTHLWQALDPRRDPIGPLIPREEWTHTNSLDVAADGRVLFSCRSNSRVGIIDRAGPKLLWRLGTPQTSVQHHATFLPNGNVQIFDNGHYAIDFPFSRVIEVNPTSGELVWEYKADPPVQFFSGHISGAERLPGDNVLICEGASGRLFEVTRLKEIVWEWVSPFNVQSPAGSSPAIFRAHRYGPDHAALAGRDLDPGRLHGLNALYELS